MARRSKGDIERFSLKAEPYGRRSFIHCGKKHKDDDGYGNKGYGY